MTAVAALLSWLIPAAEAAEQKSPGMPQLDVATFPSQIAWLAITFGVLYLLMHFVGLPRLGRILETRRQRIGDDLAQAARMKDEAEMVIAAYEKALARARDEAQATLRETVERMNAESAKRMKTLADALAAETLLAERRIAAAKADALANLRDVAVDVARAAALKVAGAELDPAYARAAVDRVMRERA
jgi:F-type H+-transporting ATPase subunit b